MGIRGRRKKNHEIQSISTRTQRVLPVLDVAAGLPYVSGTPLGGVLTGAAMGRLAAGEGRDWPGSRISPEELAKHSEAVRRGTL